MAETKLLARGFNFEINTGTIGSPVWVPIKGINSWDWSSSKSDADTTDFDDNGVQAHLPASRGYTMTLDGLRLEDTADGSRDPGQEAVEDLADLVGPAGLAQFRWYQETSLKGKSFMGSVNVTGPGGGNDDAASWSAEITVSGAVTPITVTP